MPKEIVKEPQIIELLQNYYGIEAQSAQPQFLGADSNAFIYKVGTKSGTYFVKLKHDHQEDINLAIIQLLHDSGIKEIIFPVRTIDGKLFKQFGRYQIIVYPFIDGQNGFYQQLSEKQWKQLGKTLKEIHQLSLPISILQQLRKETYSSKWRETVRSLYHTIESDISVDNITIDFREFFKNNIDSIDKLVNSSEELSKKILPHSNNYVLCHSDIHAGNILIANDASLHIVDWDAPMMAPKERDLMFIGGGVGNVWNKPQETVYFYAGYGESNIDMTILSYYRHERIVEDIASFGQDLLSQTQTSQSKLVMLKHFKAMFEPNGVVDIAFNTGD